MAQHGVLGEAGEITPPTNQLLLTVPVLPLLAHGQVPTVLAN